MYQKALSLLLVATLTLPTFSRLGVIIGYQLNQEYITRVFCVNKTKTELDCKGKCYLTKQLKAQAEQEAQLPEALKKLPELPLFYAAATVSLPAFSSVAQEIFFCGHSLRRYLSPVLSIFQPPKI